MKLSKNLSLAEVVRSDTAKRLGIDNTPNNVGSKSKLILYHFIIILTKCNCS